MIFIYYIFMFIILVTYFIYFISVNYLYIIYILFMVIINYIYICLYFKLLNIKIGLLIIIWLLHFYPLFMQYIPKVMFLFLWIPKKPIFLLYISWCAFFLNVRLEKICLIYACFCVFKGYPSPIFPPLPSRRVTPTHFAKKVLQRCCIALKCVIQ